MSGQRGAVLSILPPESPNQTWVRNDDVLKLIVTAQPQDDLRQFIEQESLKVPPPKHATREKLNVLADLMNAAEGNTRGKPLKAEATDVWATVNLPYTAVRKPQEVAFGKKAQTLWVNEIQIEKPNGFVGNIDVGVADAAVTRGGAVSVPPFLQAAQYGYKPMRLPSNTRGTAEDVLVISIEAEGNTNRAVTAKNPLTLTLPENLVQGADDVLPIAFDGEDFLVVGSANPANLREVTLWQMPDAVATAPAGGPTVRGVSRVVRLYLMTKIGRHIEDIGLRFGKMENGAAVYSAVPDKFFKKGQKQTVALLVHGFISDTEWMVRDIPQIAGQKYAHVLTFDYETFGTGISDNGQELAMALQRSGLSATDDVTLHVYAHSMGCLVTRSLVELHGGNAFVDKAVLAGPPNKGTTLANLSRGLVFLITEALNIAGNSLWASGGNWLLSKLADDAQGWADLKTNSDLVKTLRAQPDPAQTQYLVLAGDNTAIPANASQVARLAQKLIGKTMDEVFGEKDNDAVIGMSSLSQVRGVGSNAVLQVAPCDHFRYYADPTNREKIISWI
jgi:pimeloyl-ACP methyl ester carboxylesterase